MKTKKERVAPPVKVVHFRNLPPKCGWEEINEHLTNYSIELHHIYNTQALVQFTNSEEANKFISNNKNSRYFNISCWVCKIY